MPCKLTVRGTGDVGGPALRGGNATATHVVKAVPFACGALPGLLDALPDPLRAGRGLPP